MSDQPSPPPDAGQTPTDQHPTSRPLHQRQGTTPTPAATQEWVTIGRIVAVFGLHGEVKVVPQTDLPDRFARLRAIYLGPAHQRYQIVRSRPHQGSLTVLAFEGINTANDAEKLVGLTVMIPLAEIAALPPDQYYIHDLIGLRAQTPDGQPLGTLVDILATGGNDVYVVREAGSGRDVLVPAVKEMIKRVDISAGVVVIDPIPGLFDDRFEVAE